MLTPFNSSQWNFQTAAHLLNRAGFGGSPEEIEALQKLGFRGAVDSILNAPDDSAAFPRPAWAVPTNMIAMRASMVMLTDEQRKERQKETRKMQVGDFKDLVPWWLERMQKTSNPLREKLTLFWHGHFATSFVKVRSCYLMWLQNETLRRQALGNFNHMVKDMSRDPAMLVWLDGAQNRREHPNENFARELMELFTLGIGNYTEQDIQQSARAFTGYRINPQDQTFRFAPFQHDDGEKTFFGKTGRFGGDDIINLILDKPVCATYITKKIWEFFADDDAPPGVIDSLAFNFRASGYEIRPLMREIFESAVFYSPGVVRAQIKSPVQWMVQTSKELETDVPNTAATINVLRQMGQVPFMPPSVKGWDGGKSWITTSTLLLRYNLSNYALGVGPMAMQRFRVKENNTQKPPVQMPPPPPVDVAKIAPAEMRSQPEKLIASLARRLFQSPLDTRQTDTFVQFLNSKKPDTSDQTVRELLHLMMSTPQFQLT